MKKKKQKQRRTHGSGSIYHPKNAKSLWIKHYDANGVMCRESAKTMDYTVAQKLLSVRMAEVVKDERPSVEAAKVTLVDLFDALVLEYKNQGQSSLPDLESRWKLHLQPWFGSKKAGEVSSDLIRRYVSHRKATAKNSTINRELAILKRMYNLGIQDEKIQRKPFIKMQDERGSIRQGYVEDDEYLKLAEYFAGVGLWMRSIFEVGFTYGLRTSSILSLKVGQIDLKTKQLRVAADNMKNGDPLTVPLTNVLYQLLKQCCEGKKREDWLFTRNGKRVKDFRGIWVNGCIAAGHPERLFHDLRRTACRNMISASIPEKTAMLISSHKTRNVFDRYNITNERDMSVAVGKLESHREATFSQKLSQNEPKQPVPEPLPVRPN